MLKNNYKYFLIKHHMSLTTGGYNYYFHSEFKFLKYETIASFSI